MSDIYMHVFRSCVQLSTDTETESEAEKEVKGEKTPLVPSTIDEGTGYTQV